MLSELEKIRCRVLKNSALSSQNSGKLHDTVKKQFKTYSSFSISTQNRGSYILCNETRTLYQCPKFILNNVKQRLKFAKGKHLSMNSLISNVSVLINRSTVILDNI